MYIRTGEPMYLNLRKKITTGLRRHRGHYRVHPENGLLYYCGNFGVAPLQKVKKVCRITIVLSDMDTS